MGILDKIHSLPKNIYHGSKNKIGDPVKNKVHDMIYEINDEEQILTSQGKMNRLKKRALKELKSHTKFSFYVAHINNFRRNKEKIIDLYNTQNPQDASQISLLNNLNSIKQGFIYKAKSISDKIKIDENLNDIECDEIYNYLKSEVINIILDIEEKETKKYNSKSEMMGIGSMIGFGFSWLMSTSIEYFAYFLAVIILFFEWNAIIIPGDGSIISAIVWSIIFILILFLNDKYISGE